MSSESDIFEGFGAMTLKDTSSSSGKLKKEDTSLMKKNKKKKEEVVRKLIKKKKSNNNNNNNKAATSASGGVVAERRKARIVDRFNAGLPKEWGRIYYGVNRSVSETMFFAHITYPDGRLVCLGTFRSSKLAAMAYDQAAFHLYGSQLPLNFPSDLLFGNNNNN